MPPGARLRPDVHELHHEVLVHAHETLLQRLEVLPLPLRSSPDLPLDADPLAGPEAPHQALHLHGRPVSAVVLARSLYAQQLLAVLLHVHLGLLAPHHRLHLGHCPHLPYLCAFHLTEVQQPHLQLEADAQLAQKPRHNIDLLLSVPLDHLDEALDHPSGVDNSSHEELDLVAPLRDRQLRRLYPQVAPNLSLYLAGIAAQELLQSPLTRNPHPRQALYLHHEGSVVHVLSAVVLGTHAIVVGHARRLCLP
mmetsp:Transcript_884/g.1967  ORF Transcript_884/g.1967 Transcript_884/m.1967 type:complete len:251 (-) Transcript_884:41-793(-)